MVNTLIASPGSGFRRSFYQITNLLQIQPDYSGALRLKIRFQNFSHKANNPISSRKITKISIKNVLLRDILKVTIHGKTRLEKSAIQLY